MKQEMIGSVPGNVLGMMADLAHKLQKGAITPKQFARFLKKENPFSIPTSLEEKVVDWQDFYLNLFGMVCDFSKVSIPERRMGFDRLIIIPQGLTVQRVYDQCAVLFKCWIYCDSPDNKMSFNGYDETSSAYAVWVRERVEADEEHKKKSANLLKKEGVSGITLLKRLIYELKYFQETGKHLDLQNVTLCSGSCSSDGGVHSVCWRVDKLYVDWYNPDDTYDTLRTREVCY